ncbi:MAG: GntR family transcriptional regulator [Nocardioidaceae bacterium]
MHAQSRSAGPSSHSAGTSAADRAYAHVKDGILNGSYPGGTFLTEGQIATDVEVSRTPVREALLRLEAEGLLSLHPKKGALVVSVSGKEADGILEARELIETWATPHAFNRRDVLVERLRPLLQQMRDHRSHGAITAFTETDRAFHEEIVAAAGNDVLTRFYRSLRERQLCINAAAMRVDDQRMDVAIADHQAMVDALSDADDSTFADLVIDHVQRAAGRARGLR